MDEKFPSIIFSVPPQKDKRQTPVRGHDGKVFMHNISQSEVAFVGKCRVVASKDEFFGGERSKPYVGPVLTNPTWRKIKGEAKKAMRKTLDLHHVFLEGVYPDKDGPDADGVTNLRLSMGS